MNERKDNVSAKPFKAKTVKGGKIEKKEKKKSSPGTKKVKANRSKTDPIITELSGDIIENEIRGNDQTFPISDDVLTPFPNNSPSRGVRSEDPGDRYRALMSRLEHGKAILGKGVRISQNKEFMIDSGATYVMVNKTDYFKPGTFRFCNNKYVHLGDDSPIAIEGTGTIDLMFSETEKREVKDVLYVPKLAESLISISHLLGNSNDHVEIGKHRPDTGNWKKTQ